MSEIDIKVFTAQSCRSGSVSKAKANEMGITEIMKRGCWKSESTFKNLYDKDTINDDSDKLNYESLKYNSILIKKNFYKELFMEFWKYGFIYELHLSVALKISYSLLSAAELRGVITKQPNTWV